MADDARFGTKAGEIIRLWPDGPPSALPGVGPEAAFLRAAAGRADTTMLRNVSDPTLTVFAPDPAKANGVGVIVCPGGGWQVLAWEHGGVDLAHWLAARGYAAFLLKYRVRGTPPDPAAFDQASAKLAASLPTQVPGALAPRALSDLIKDESVTKARQIAADDGRRAVEIVRDRAAEWGVEPGKVGMVGFSAGAFLTVDLIMAPGAAPLAFAAPIYGGETLGQPIPADAPPLFTVIAQDDRLLFRVVEGLFADWSSADRPAELHIFTRGGHGFGMVRQGLPVDRWIDLFGDWLTDQGFG